MAACVDADFAAGADGANFVVAADLDGDGDVDVLSVAEDHDTIQWYENTMAGHDQPVPTVSEWHLGVITLIVLASGTMAWR